MPRSTGEIRGRARRPRGQPPEQADHRGKLKSVLKLLRRAYGRRRPEPSADPVGVLVGTILSQNTNGVNSSAAYSRLRRAFASWQQMADAPVGEIINCIRTSGLAAVKAPRMRSILRRIRADRGQISLDFLAELPVEEAYRYLTAFDGVGPKTAWCVLLFAFAANVFPVDTHIRRIAIRLGIIDPNTSAERAHDVLTPLIRPADRYETHVLLIAHGRKTCLARKPRCPRCNLLKLCPHGQNSMSEGPARQGAGGSVIP